MCNRVRKDGKSPEEWEKVITDRRYNAEERECTRVQKLLNCIALMSQMRLDDGADGKIKHMHRLRHIYQMSRWQFKKERRIIPYLQELCVLIKNVVDLFSIAIYSNCVCPLLPSTKSTDVDQTAKLCFLRTHSTTCCARK